MGPDVSPPQVISHQECPSCMPGPLMQEWYQAQSVQKDHSREGKSYGITDRKGSDRKGQTTCSFRVGA